MGGRRCRPSRRRGEPPPGRAGGGGWRPVEARFTGPGFSWAGKLLVLAVGNGRQAGGGHVLCPDALLDDGLLDVSILPDPPREERAEALRDLIREGKASLLRHAVTARVPWLELEAPEAMQVNLDGEPISGTRLRFEVLPGALRVCLPVPRQGRRDALSTDDLPRLRRFLGGSTAIAALDHPTEDRASRMSSR